MKKIIVGMMFSSIVLLTSCGPSICDCLDNAKKGVDADLGMAQKCVELEKDMDEEDLYEEMKSCN